MTAMLEQGFMRQALLAALLAGDAAGGDARGRQSAALYAVAPGAGCARTVTGHAGASSDVATLPAAAPRKFRRVLDRICQAPDSGRPRPG